MSRLCAGASKTVDVDDALPLRLWEIACYDRLSAAALFHALGELSQACLEYRFGQMITNLALLAQGSNQEAIWDVEDKELLDAVRKHLDDWKQRHAHFTQVEWGPIYLAAGVTTARDCANEFEFITAARDAIAGGHGLGPRLLPAGIIDGEGPSTIGVDTASTPEQALALIRRYADAGFLQIKIYSSLKPELVAEIAREAHRWGMSRTGHLPEGMELQSAVEAGMDQIDHSHEEHASS